MKVTDGEGWGQGAWAEAGVLGARVGFFFLGEWDLSRWEGFSDLALLTSVGLSGSVAGAGGEGWRVELSWTVWDVQHPVWSLYHRRQWCLAPGCDITTHPLKVGDRESSQERTTGVDLNPSKPRFLLFLKKQVACRFHPHLSFFLCLWRSCFHTPSSAAEQPSLEIDGSEELCHWNLISNYSNCSPLFAPSGHWDQTLGCSSMPWSIQFQFGLNEWLFWLLLPCLCVSVRGCTRAHMCVDEGWARWPG